MDCIEGAKTDERFKGDSSQCKHNTKESTGQLANDNSKTHKFTNKLKINK
jgi:hypothetical protein